MTFDLKRMLESKSALRRKLAKRPLAEKLAMLDTLRERALAVREAVEFTRRSAARETPAKYQAERDKEQRSKR